MMTIVESAYLANNLASKKTPSPLPTDWACYVEPPPALVLFDSGLGGISVLLELLQDQFPHPVHYVADTAYMPYGSKTQEALEQRLSDVFKAINQQWPQAPIALCCNTASTIWGFLPWATPSLKPKNIVTWNNITPTIATLKQALSPEKEKSYHLAILATQFTIASRVYQTQLKANHLPIHTLTTVPCTGLAASIEHHPEYPSTATLLDTYVKPLATQSIDWLLLGCTHYQFIRDDIQALVPQSTLLSQSRLMANAINTAFHYQPPAKKTTTAPTTSVTLWATSNPNQFQDLCAPWLPTPLPCQLLTV